MGTESCSVTTRNRSGMQYFLLLGLLIMIIFQPPSASATEKMETAVDLSTAIIRIAKQNIPAVVHIEVTERQEVMNPLLPFENDPFFRHFFGGSKMPRKFKREVKGVGSGMIIDSRGYILTNHHVAGGATKLEVVLSDGTRFPAKLVGTDAKTDLAVIKIEAKKQLPHVTFGDSDNFLGINDQPVSGLDGFVTLTSNLKSKEKINILALDHRTGNMGTIQVETR